MDGEGFDPPDLTPVVVARFLGHRRAADRAHHLSPKALVPLFTFLRGLGAMAPPAEEAPTGAVAELLARYLRFLQPDLFSLACRTGEA